jgi:hypothetical protein
MISLNENTSGSLCRTHKRGDTRHDGFIFWQYHKRKKNNGEHYIRECWLSPEVYEKTIIKKNIGAAERMRKLRRDKLYVAKEKARMEMPEVKEKRLAYLRKWQNNKRKKDKLFMMRKDISSRIRESFTINGFRKKSKTKEILGCSSNFFCAYIEARFLDGMSWENRSKWHIDHIIPTSSAKTERDIIKLNHYTNLRPMWASDNIKKSNKMPSEQLELIKN